MLECARLKGKARARSDRVVPDHDWFISLISFKINDRGISGGNGRTSHKTSWPVMSFQNRPTPSTLTDHQRP